MLKHEELSDPDSCWNKAKDDELVFVLLGRDESSPTAIQAWVLDRIRRKKNNPQEMQLVEADAIARQMIYQQEMSK